MKTLLSPKSKLLCAAALLAVTGLASVAHQLNVVSAARWILGGACVAGMALWAARAKKNVAGPALEPRLTVRARAGLSQRCSVALVEADGRSYLVAFGDGFASIHEPTEKRPAARTAMVQARRPRPTPRKKAVAR